MARKRKKSVTNPSRIAIRQSNGAATTLSEIFKNTSCTQFQEVLKWSYPRYKTRIFFSGFAPNSSSQLAQWNYFPFESPTEAFKWISAVTNFKSEEVEKYNDFVLQVENFGSNFGDIHKAAITLLSKTMVSYAGLSTLLYSLSKSSGLDSQRRWMNEYLYVSNASLANVLFYFKGIASEGGRDPEDIRSTMYAALFVHIDNPEFAQLISNVILYTPVDLLEFKDIAKLMANQPVIDQYELAANVVCSNQHVLAGIHDENVNLFLDCMVNTGDWRAQSIKYLSDEITSGHVYVPLSDHKSAIFFNNLLKDPTGEKLNEREFRTTLANKFFCTQSTPASYLASSSYLIKSANSIEAFQQGIARREIAQASKSKLSPSKSGRRKILLTFDKLAHESKSAGTLLEKRELFRLACLSGMNEGRIFDVLLCLYETSQSDPKAYTYFPTFTFFNQCSEETIIDSSTDARISVAISRIKQDVHEDYESVQYLSVEQFLNGIGLQKPSQIVAKPGPYSDFLFETCTLDCLRQSLEFETKLEVEEERLSILTTLTIADTQNKEKYEKEAHVIIGRQTVDELLQRYEVGKIHCDEKAILSWAKEELAAKFVRLRDYIMVDLLPVEKDADIEFLSHISAGKEGKFTFKVPNSEAFSIASSIITELANKYALDPRHGIDSYLSLGMRHGELEEHLRTPLSSKQLLTSNGPTGYEATDFWCGTFSSYTGGQLGHIIAEFSQKYDKALKDIKDELVQVKRDEKPRGIIDLEWQDVEIITFAPTFSRVDNIEDFLEEFSTVYWQFVDLRLAPSRMKVHDDIAPVLNSLLDELQHRAETHTGEMRLGPFSDAITRAREDLDAAIRELASWHNIAKSTDTEPIALLDIISAAEKIVARIYPGFDPLLETSGDTNVTLTSSLHVLIEVFKALFINVYKHSGIDQPTIKVSIDAAVDDQLVVEFSSTCTDIDAGEASAKLANDRIRTGEYEARLPKEGGSGLPKVARATVKDGRPNTVVSVDRDHSLFCVQMTFNLLNL